MTERGRDTERNAVMQEKLQQGWERESSSCSSYARSENEVRNAAPSGSAFPTSAEGVDWRPLP